MPFLNGTWTAWEIINSSAISGPQDLIKYVNNDVSGGMFSIGLLLVVLLVVFIAGSNRAPFLYFAVGSYISTVLSVLFAALDIMPDGYVLSFIVLSVVSTILLYKGTGGSPHAI